MATGDQETLGRRIARLRLQHAMTQERLANIANVSAQAVSKWGSDVQRLGATHKRLSLDDGNSLG